MTSFIWIPNSVFREFYDFLHPVLGHKQLWRCFHSIISRICISGSYLATLRFTQSELHRLFLTIWRFSSSQSKGLTGRHIPSILEVCKETTEQRTIQRKGLYNFRFSKYYLQRYTSEFSVSRTAKSQICDSRGWSSTNLRLWIMKLQDFLILE